MDKEVVKNTKFKTLTTNVNTLEKKILDASTLIQTNQQNADKQNFEKKLEMLRKRFLTLLVSNYSCS